MKQRFWQMPNSSVFFFLAMDFAGPITRVKKRKKKQKSLWQLPSTS